MIIKSDKSIGKIDESGKVELSCKKIMINTLY